MLKKQMLIVKRPKEGVFTGREEGRVKSSKDKCTRSLPLQAGSRWEIKPFCAELGLEVGVITP